MILGAGLTLVTGLLTAALLLGALLAVLWWFDRCEDEPVKALVLAGGWGVIAAAVVGQALQRGWVSGQGGAPGGDPGGLTADLVLLAAVGRTVLAVGVALLSRRVDGPTDGLLVGCAAGLGWGVCEAATTTTALPAEAEGAVPGMSTLVLLVAAGIGANALTIGAFGGLVGVARLSRRTTARILWLAGGLTLAILLDTCWRWGRGAVAQSSHGWPAAALLLGLVVAVLALLLWLLLGAEERVLSEELEEELTFRVVPAWVVRTLPSYRKRVRGDWWPERRTRVVVARLLSRLALRKRAVRGLPSAAAGLAALEVGKLRSRARTLLLPGSPDEE